MSPLLPNMLINIQWWRGQIPRFFKRPHLSVSSINLSPLRLYKPLLMLILFIKSLAFYLSQFSSFSITSTFSAIPMATVEVTLLNTFYYTLIHIVLQFRTSTKISLLMLFWHYFILFCFQFHHHIFVLLVFLLLCYLKQETIHFFSL